MSSKTVSDQLVTMLVQAGVKRVYAVTGDSLNFVNDAIRRDGQIEWIHVRNEETGAFAAGAEAQLNGIACCAGSSGPGHVHLLNGLYDAHKSNASVIAIASTCHSTEFGTDSFQETNTIKLFDDCSCYNQIAVTPQQFPRMFQATIQHAIHKKGVAVLGLPGDITDMHAVESPTAMQIYHTNPVIQPSNDELQALADLLQEHSKITIFCGIGAAHAHDEVVQLSKLLHAPVGYSFKGKMGIQYDNPNEIGMTGLLGLPSAFQSMHESDLVLLLGTDFPYSDFMPVKNKIVQIDTAPEKLGRRAKLDMGLCGNIKDTLIALLPLLSQQPDGFFLKKQLDGYAEVKEHLKSYVNDPGKKDLIHPEYLASRIDALSANDAIYTVDTGMTCVWAARYLNATGERTLLGSFNHGSMANAMPQAIGAALACPDRQVIAMCGDGGISMMLGDIMTIVQYKLPVKLIVFNNHSLGMVKLEMEVSGLPDWQTDMVNPDFAKIAEAMGMRALTVNDPANVDEALSEAFAYNGPMLLNVITDPNALAMPPKITFEQMKGMATSMTKLMLSGRMDDVWKTIESNKKHLKELL
ncbi:ubiquinone-dependent pyruvate dehydrogenase [Cytophaga aurantiaca]|uniref:ubiquinone-dependent pyruvate dehydrogenase n=1 Tax=Cytophaga aurantiaca TaxID=29530 RepID=UPI00037BF105|nr:ubiquinone-dependent pyruvate dehydrogenase [Cytophaga aurantiaca]